MYTKSNQLEICNGKNTLSIRQKNIYTYHETSSNNLNNKLPNLMEIPTQFTHGHKISLNKRRQPRSWKLRITTGKMQKQEEKL